MSTNGQPVSVPLSKAENSPTENRAESTSSNVNGGNSSNSGSIFDKIPDESETAAIGPDGKPVNKPLQGKDKVAALQSTGIQHARALWLIVPILLVVIAIGLWFVNKTAALVIGLIAGVLLLIFLAVRAYMKKKSKKAPNKTNSNGTNQRQRRSLFNRNRNGRNPINRSANGPGGPGRNSNSRSRNPFRRNPDGTRRSSFRNPDGSRRNPFRRNRDRDTSRTRSRNPQNPTGRPPGRDRRRTRNTDPQNPRSRWNPFRRRNRSNNATNPTSRPTSGPNSPNTKNNNSPNRRHRGGRWNPFNWGSSSGSNGNGNGGDRKRNNNTSGNGNNGNSGTKGRSWYKPWRWFGGGNGSGSGGGQNTPNVPTAGSTSNTNTNPSWWQRRRNRWNNGRQNRRDWRNWWTATGPDYRSHRRTYVDGGIPTNSRNATDTRGEDHGYHESVDDGSEDDTAGASRVWSHRPDREHPHGGPINSTTELGPSVQHLTSGAYGQDTQPTEAGENAMATRSSNGPVQDAQTGQPVAATHINSAGHTNHSAVQHIIAANRERNIAGTYLQSNDPDLHAAAQGHLMRAAALEDVARNRAALTAGHAAIASSAGNSRAVE